MRGCTCFIWGIRSSVNHLLHPQAGLSCGLPESCEFQTSAMKGFVDCVQAFDKGAGAKPAKKKASKKPRTLEVSQLEANSEGQFEGWDSFAVNRFLLNIVRYTVTASKHLIKARALNPARKKGLVQTVNIGGTNCKADETWKSDKR